MNEFIRKFISIDVQLEQPFNRGRFSPSKVIVYGALLACLTAILQSAGNFGGIGFLISALSTMPILLAAYLYFRMGFLSYMVAFLLIALIQPSEFFVYPFTTGLLGLCMGFTLRFLKKGIIVTLISGASLTIGILVILYIFQFPVLGPSVSSRPSLSAIVLILLFSIVYSWVWLKLSIFFINRINRFSRKMK